MKRLPFYLHYALRNLRRNRRWSSFAILSVAAGVATVVALRSLGLAIGESLSSNVQASNMGDITLQKNSGPGDFFFGTTSAENYFTDEQLTTIRTWALEHTARIAEYSTTNLQITASDRQAPLLSFMTGILIDPATYPPIDPIRAITPADVALVDLLLAPEQVVISENLATSQEIEVGEQVRVTGTDQAFTVVGIVATEVEAGLRSPFAAVFGFAYFRADAALILRFNPAPNHISLTLPQGTSLQEITQGAQDLNRLLEGTPGFTRIVSVPALLRQNEFIADAISRFIVILGLGAMLIGGVGIINTMLVMVRRRTEEIAALKTFGLKGRQIALLFMSEALLYGMLGSLFGSVVGAFLSRITNAYGERFILQSVPWRIYPEALIFGMVLGVVVTGVFGIIPVLTAVKVRPSIILRPNEAYFPVLGILQSVGVMLFVVVALGFIAGQIIGPFPRSIKTFSELPLPQNITAGLLLVAVTLSILGLLVLVLWALIWLVGKFPAMGWVDLNLSLRNLTTRRLRTATTLLAISTGIFAISSISFYGAGVREILNVAVSDTFGGNILVLNPSSFYDVSGNVSTRNQDLLDSTLDHLGELVEYRTHIQTFEGRIVRVDEIDLRNVEIGINREVLRQELNIASANGDFDRMHELAMQIENLQTPINLATVETDNPAFTPPGVYTGRQLTAADAGQHVAVVLMEPRMVAWNVEVGTQILVSINMEEIAFTVVGLIRDDSDFQPDTFGALTIPVGALANAQPSFQFNAVQVEPENMLTVQEAISNLPFFFTLDVKLIDGILSRLIDQFSALPFLVGLLSLMAAAVIMANTVALATFERRRQIGILKAVGLRRTRIVRIMLIENLIISLLGALIGIGASIVGLGLLTAFGLETLVLLPEDARPVAVALIVASVMIGGAATLFSARPAVQERVMNVLRYE